MLMVGHRHNQEGHRPNLQHQDDQERSPHVRSFRRGHLRDQAQAISRWLPEAIWRHPQVQCRRGNCQVQGQFYRSYTQPSRNLPFTQGLREKLAPFVVDQIPLLASAKESKAKILVEGANALMLDIDYGTYPFVTSSNTGLGGVITGLNLGWRSLREVIGVVKAYTTRVGS